jgi:hypothetical protein
MTLLFVLVILGLFNFYVIKKFIPLVHSFYHRHALMHNMVPAYVQLPARQHLTISQNVEPYCKFPKSNLNRLAFFMELMALKQISQWVTYH